MPKQIRPATWVDDPDGVGDKRWADCTPLSLVNMLTGEPPELPTDVRITTSPSTLWIRFACTAGTIRATMTRYKDKVWQEGAVEVYVRPPATEHLYECQLSPIGTFRDLKVWYAGMPNQRNDDSWSCAGAIIDARIIRSADHEITGWQAMFGLPWRSLSDTAPGANKWHIGLFRLERDPEELSSLVSCAGREVNFRDPGLLVPLADTRHLAA